MQTFTQLREALIQRVTVVRNQQVKRKLQTETPYKMDKTRSVRMSPEELRNRRKGADKAARHGRDRKDAAVRERRLSDNIRKARHVDDNEANY